MELIQRITLCDHVTVYVLIVARETFSPVLPVINAVIMKRRQQPSCRYALQ